MPRSYIEEVMDMDFPKVQTPEVSIETGMFVGSVATCIMLAIYSRFLEIKKCKQEFSKFVEGATISLEGEETDPLSVISKPGENLSTESSVGSASYASLRWRYLGVYLPGVFGDWIQGAYLYALYRAYQLDMADIGYLFMIGYSTSAVLGTYVAAMGDRYGHRLCVGIYGVLYSLSCLTMHYGNFWVLLIGRVLGGVAYSLLYSSFEAWAVAEATRCGKREALPQLFASATFANAVSAVAAGATPGGVGAMKTSSLGVENGFTLPFDTAIPALLLCSVGARVLWREHRGGVYGGDTRGSLAVGSIRQAYDTILAATGLRSVMAMIALYESALYVFVFLWTPVLEARAEVQGRASPSSEIPHGLIFSLFMCCKMAGSQVFVLVLGERLHAARILSGVFGLSVMCFAVPMVTSSYVATLVAFCVYEFGLGLYWPAIAILRANMVPDDIRSSVASSISGTIEHSGHRMPAPDWPSPRERSPSSQLPPASNMFVVIDDIAESKQHEGVLLICSTPTLCLSVQ
eukprot:CAMPEP_0114276252 /NCGR_PEP_ID=MMETSP0059-20121206/138_1 /TAXON_ID=36894 /ORGANISM="Pyramimonas parkeae, Strain CCMP726" /LENGTH=517 /DNA_ID=CAMNT_0001396239 /DNA_START=93 /DNA_END=1645 /DNA_ORIENTATION=-